MTTQTHSGTLVAESCPTCHIVYGLPRDLYNARREDHRQVYCPNGHTWWYTGETEAQKLRRRLERAEASATHQRDQREAAERSNRALKGVITKTKRRVGKGACPCCTRSFPNLADHMATKHPDYAEGVAS